MRSAGATSTCSPRFPPLTNTVVNCSTVASTNVGRERRCPKGLIPPGRYPVNRAACAGSAIVALLPPVTRARALVERRSDTGITATACEPSVRARTSYS